MVHLCADWFTIFYVGIFFLLRCISWLILVVKSYMCMFNYSSNMATSFSTTIKLLEEEEDDLDLSLGGPLVFSIEEDY
jgi:hypothetical protein